MPEDLPEICVMADRALGIVPTKIPVVAGQHRFAGIHLNTAIIRKVPVYLAPHLRAARD